MADTHAPSPDAGRRLNPWAFVPLLYFMQAIPVTIVQEVASVLYKDLGIANEPITRWTSLISLPWSLQLLLGPLVDLNGTKRRWILGGQALIAVGLIATAFSLRIPYAFEISLLILAATAVTSALCNIATDGFYLLSMPKGEQARFVGVQTTCYRLGRLFCTGLLVLFVGLLTRLPSVPVTAPTGQYLAFKKGNEVTYSRVAALEVRQGFLASKFGKIEPEIAVPTGVYGMKVETDGRIMVRRVTGTEQIGPLVLATPPTDARPVEGEPDVLRGAAPASTTPAAQLSVGSEVDGMNPVTAWTVILAVAGGIYLLGHLGNRVVLPRPAADQLSDDPVPGETQRNILRTVLLVVLGVGGFFTINAVLRLLLNFAGVPILRAVGVDPKGWILPAENKIQVGTLSYSAGAVGTELLQLAICGTLVFVALAASRRLIRGTPMAEALTSFVRQPGFPAILAFILFYRFGEAMVVKMSPLFLKDSLDKGGLAVANEQLGIIKGLFGVVGIIIGGLLGGAVVSRFGLKRSFWGIAIFMHLPNFLYLLAAVQGAQLPLGVVEIPGLGPIPMTLAAIDFLEQFGYGFGFAGYMVYLMWVAQRGNYKTTHYAIGTGMGALCIATAGAVSGVLYENFGYRGVFLWAIILAIPGLLTLFFIPLDENHGKREAANA